MNISGNNIFVTGKNTFCNARYVLRWKGKSREYVKTAGITHNAQRHATTCQMPQSKSTRESLRPGSDSSLHKCKHILIVTINRIRSSSSSVLIAYNNIRTAGTLHKSH